MNHSLLQLLRSCRSLRSLKSIHAHLLINGSFASSDLIVNKLLRSYSCFGATHIARDVFDEITEPNAFLWTSMIHGYVENQQYADAYGLFCRMHSMAVAPLSFTVSSVFKALSKQTRLRDGVSVYGLVLKSGLVVDTIVQNALLEFLMKCGEVDVGRWVFDEMKEKCTVSWNTMISGYGNCGKVDMARELFESMPERNVISWTSLICGYAKTGAMGEAGILFDAMPVKDLAAWKVMVSGYMDSGDTDNARIIFQSMPSRDVATWNLMVAGFCKAGDLRSAIDTFNTMPHRNVASWTMMLDGYIKVGDIAGAKILFDQMPGKNLVSWSMMIRGFTKYGQPRKALEMIDTFKQQGIRPDETFILEVISACSQLGTLDKAEAIIRDYAGAPLSSNIRVVTSLIDMYAKCGSIEKALKVFNVADPKDLLCYSSMIAAFANHGLDKDAISLFNRMLREHIKPDAVSFLGVLSACNHGGLVDEGWKYFKQMSDEFGLQPSEKHFSCIIDILGRAGHLEEAHKLITEMPISPTSVVWGALLAACRVHRNVPMAEVVASELFKIEPENSGNYILLSNIYAAAGMWSDVTKVRAMIREHHVKKNKGSSWIELDQIVHEFVMGDTSHSDSGSIYVMLNLLFQEMRLLDYVLSSKMNEFVSISALWPNLYPPDILELDDYKEAEIL